MSIRGSMTVHETATVDAAGAIPLFAKLKSVLRTGPQDRGSIALVTPDPPRETAHDRRGPAIHLGRLRILNLYAGIGGNRRLWEGHDITAVERDARVAAVYRSFFPTDAVVVGDAHEYLRQNYGRFDFIWSSPPCQSHSRLRHAGSFWKRGPEPIYPDLRLYEEILFLKHRARCRWVIENVIPFYKPLLPGTVIQRHLFWSNFSISKRQFEPDGIKGANVAALQATHGFELSMHRLKDKRLALKNCVRPELGLHVLQEALRDAGPSELVSIRSEVN